MTVDKQRTGARANGTAAPEKEPAAAIAVPDAPDNPLSEREMEVARLLVTGATNSEIARVLVISPHTVKVHLRNVFEKLSVNSRTEASMVLLQRGWVVMPGMEAPEAEAEPPVPEPEPLADIAPQPQLWQIGLVGLTLVVCLVALMLPVWFPRPKSPIGLLSDLGQTVVGPPVLESLPRWEQISPLAQPTSRLAVTQAGDELYALGGENAEGVTLADAAVFDVRAGTWTAIADLPSPRANVAAAWTGDTLVVAGGSALDPDDVMDWTIFDDLLRYDPSADRWYSAGRLPVPLAGAALAYYEGSLYLVGGWDGVTMHAEIWQLPVTALGRASPADWDVVTRMATPAAFFGSVVVDRTLYVVGGYDGRRELTDAARYDLVAGVWERLPSLSTPRSGLGLVNDGVSVVALGGGWGSTIQTHERLDTATNQWLDIASPIQGEWRHFGAAAHEGNIYMLGGWSGDYLATNLRFQSTFRAMLPVIPQGNK